MLVQWVLLRMVVHLLHRTNDSFKLFYESRGDTSPYFIRRNIFSHNAASAYYHIISDIYRFRNNRMRSNKDIVTNFDLTIFVSMGISRCLDIMSKNNTSHRDSAIITNFYILRVLTIKYNLLSDKRFSYSYPPILINANLSFWGKRFDIENLRHSAFTLRLILMLHYFIS